MLLLFLGGSLMSEKNQTKSATRVTRLWLQNFRGVVGPVTIPFSRGNVIAKSLIVYGENGTGKSSVADAIEFVTRGVVSRRSIGGVKHRREIRNHSAERGPTVFVALDNGESYWRGTPAWPRTADIEAATRLKGDAVIKGFDICPVVLRRDVIEIFWRISEQDRLELFWDYFRPPGTHFRTPVESDLIDAHKAAERRVLQTGKALTARLAPVRSDRNFKLPTHAKAVAKFSSNLKEIAVGDLRKAKRALKNYSDALELERSIHGKAENASSKPAKDLEVIRSIVAKIGPEIAKSFAEVSRESWITDVRVEISDANSLEITLARDGRPALRPEEVLSEANLDLLALFVFLHIHIACSNKGQLRVIVLDDVFQSVDATLRSRSLEKIAQLLRDWQIILTVHDRLWLEIAARRLREAGVELELVELRGGGYGATPTIMGATGGPLRDLEQVLNSRQSAVVVASVAGRALEALLDQMTINLRARVRRNPDGEYSLGELFDSLKEEMKSCGDPQITSLMSDAKFGQFLRNRVGSHFATWGDGLTEVEAEDCAITVRELSNKFFCSQCGAAGKRVNGSDSKWAIEFKCH
jgi:hypothetical protein